MSSHRLTNHPADFNRRRIGYNVPEARLPPQYVGTGQFIRRILKEGSQGLERHSDVAILLTHLYVYIGGCRYVKSNQRTCFASAWCYGQPNEVHNI
jgi:hypothetical protein